tara:strand:+ start:240 stop:899 length:660 start_codon:yes stop_codon:yes gene_type:complete
MLGKIYVFGSKPNTIIPNDTSDIVFSANGGAYYASKYLSNLPENKIKHINISTDQGFIKIPKLREYVENSIPDKIIFRGNRIKIEKHSKIISNSSIDLEYQSYISQFLFQRKFFKKGIFDLFLAEMNYERDSYINQFLYVLKLFKSGVFLGCSTGIYTALFALSKFPNHKVYLYGISLSGGRQFYNNQKISDKDFKRYNIDQVLYKNLKNEFKNRIVFC